MAFDEWPHDDCICQLKMGPLNQFKNGPLKFDPTDTFQTNFMSVVSRIIYFSTSTVKTNSLQAFMVVPIA